MGRRDHVDRAHERALMSHRPLRIVSGPVVLCAALTLLISACSSSATGSRAATTTATSTAATSVARPPPPPLLDLSFSGLHYNGVPSAVPSGTVTLAFRNDTTVP